MVSSRIAGVSVPRISLLSTILPKRSISMNRHLPKRSDSSPPQTTMEPCRSLLPITPKTGSRHVKVDSSWPSNTGTALCENGNRSKSSMAAPHIRKKEKRPTFRPGQAFHRAVLHITNSLIVVRTPCCDRRMRIFPAAYHHRRAYVMERRFCSLCRRLWKVELVRHGKIWDSVAKVSI